jgi:hypothetical protein
MGSTREVKLTVRWTAFKPHHKEGAPNNNGEEGGGSQDESGASEGSNGLSSANGAQGAGARPRRREFPRANRRFGGPWGHAAGDNFERVMRVVANAQTYIDATNNNVLDVYPFTGRILFTPPPLFLTPKCSLVKTPSPH